MTYVFKVLIPNGLHARPCSHLIYILKDFKSVKFTHNNQTSNSLSILELLLLKVPYGGEITLSCEHPLDDSTMLKLSLFFSGSN
jgi:phosphotransferase system HPr (HPr) family protein